MKMIKGTNRLTEDKGKQLTPALIVFWIIVGGGICGAIGAAIALHLAH